MKADRPRPLPTIRFRPLDAGRWSVWGGTAAVLLALPLVLDSGFAITLLSQMGVMIVFTLSFNMIYGQGGMLSFGHAVYSGLGAYATVHALNAMAAAGGWLATPVSVALVPLVGGLAGAFFGVVFGYLTTKKAGTPFAMITLGIGEMVHAASLMFPGFFGGEGGVSTNRVMGGPLLGVTFGPGLEVYYLIAAWCFASMLLMFAFSRTPLGRISNAVRDNPERVEFIGYSARRVRFLVVVVAGFFAGVSGALAAINFELVTAENVSTLRSGGVLLAAVIGGAMFFFGPIIGAVLFVFFSVALSDYTKAWQLYLGVFFVVMIMYAPGGVASLVLTNLRVLEHGTSRALRDAYLGLLASALLLLAGMVMIVEFGYHRSLDASRSTVMTLFGLPFDTAVSSTWVVAIGTTLAGAAAFHHMQREFRRCWEQTQAAIATADSGRQPTA